MTSSPTRGAETLEVLRTRLKDGTWPLGTRLPGEHELAAELGVGRNTVREALRTLSNSGLLRARRGDGTYVIATDELEAALARRVDAEQAHLVLEVRGALEVESARLAAQRATPAHLKKLRELLAQRDEAVARRDDHGFVRVDLAWHEAVAEAADNPLLADLYTGLDRTLTYATREANHPASGGADHASTPQPRELVWADESMHRDHHLILEAIEARDPQAAAAAASRLIAASHVILDNQEQDQQ